MLFVYRVESSHRFKRNGRTSCSSSGCTSSSTWRRRSRRNEKWRARRFVWVLKHGLDVLRCAWVVLSVIDADLLLLILPRTPRTFSSSSTFFHAPRTSVIVVVLVLAFRQCASRASTLITHRHSRLKKNKTDVETEKKNYSTAESAIRVFAIYQILLSWKTCKY